MVYDAMKIVKAVENHLNLGHIPVIAADQHLFAIMKILQ